MEIRPLGDHVVLERIEAKDVTAGGIVLPESAKEKPREGRVVAVGQGRRLDSGGLVEPSIKVGDRVVFQSYAGTDVKVEGNDYLVLSESDILCVVE